MMCTLLRKSVQRKMFSSVVVTTSVSMVEVGTEELDVLVQEA